MGHTIRCAKRVVTAAALVASAPCSQAAFIVLGSETKDSLGLLRKLSGAIRWKSWASSRYPCSRER